MDAAVSFYRKHDMDDELVSYARMMDMESYANLSADKIRSSGYVVHTMEAAVWTLITTGSLEEALLQGVNLGDDADTVGAVAGGLAGLYYGYNSVPAAWKDAMQKLAWLEDMCRKAADMKF
jgi:ADP-ribosylglycohydrolase